MRQGAALRAIMLIALSALSAIALVGCSNSNSNSSAPSTSISAGKNCDLSYTLTQSAVLTGPDPLFGDQWHLTNTGQNGGTPGQDLRAAGAWSITRGSGVRVAVIDDAIEVTHPDLYPNLVEGASRSYRNGNRGSIWPVPCIKAEDDHGTAVAGLVLARDGNAIGVVGVASRASLVAYDALSTSYDIDIADALTRDGQLNSVYQNSWGSPDDGKLHPADAAFTAAITSGLLTGRQGKGSVYVFAGGNGGCYLIDEKTGKCQVDNSNFDGYVNQRGIVTVCAVDNKGVSPWYGEPGAALTVCAPSSGSNPVGVTTTALSGTYESNFSGTSASTPMVYGVIALMLSANPALTWRDVRIILAQSARRNDPTDAGWLPAAGGLQFNHKYGFGVANAQAAVALASTWSSVGGSASLKTCDSPLRTPNLPLPDAGSVDTSTPVSDSLSIAGCDISSIEFVEIFLTASHSYSGDLKVTVTSPAAAVSQLANTRICKGGGDTCGAYSNWRFGSMRHLGEAANGNWTMTVTDMSPGDTGRFDGWSLRLYGR